MSPGSAGVGATTGFAGFGACAAAACAPLGPASGVVAADAVALVIGTTTGALGGSAAGDGAGVTAGGGGGATASVSSCERVVKRINKTITATKNAATASPGMVKASNGTAGFGVGGGNGTSVIGTPTGSDADMPCVLAD